MNEKINYYVSLLEQIKQQVSDSETAIAILQQIGKDSRMEKIQSKQASENSKDEPATSKQLGFLKDLGVEIKPGLSKQEASDLISGAKDAQD